MENIQKWGFGMAPLKPKTAQRNRKALIAVKNFENGEETTNLNTLNDDISTVILVICLELKTSVMEE